MNSQLGGILARGALYSFLSGVAAGIIFIIISLVTGATLKGDVLLGGLTTGAISFVIALVIFSAISFYFARRA
jgi:hypothetical protein